MGTDRCERHDRLHLGGHVASDGLVLGGHSEALDRRAFVALAESAGDPDARRAQPRSFDQPAGIGPLFSPPGDAVPVHRSVQSSERDPGFYSPAGSLSTTAALALCVFVAVPLYGVAEQGLGGYLEHYIRPTFFMLPFHVIGELSRTLALAVRLFGNVMSGTKIVLILLAIGAFFAGLAFSRDQKKLRIDDAFRDIYEFFVPFFFIGIGLEIEPGVFRVGAGVGLVLLVTAFVSKFVPVFVPALPMMGRRRATLLGVSMVPRAEIALLVMKGGQEAGSSLVPDDVYMGMVFVSAGTCLGAPMILSRLFRMWPASAEEDGKR